MVARERRRSVPLGVVVVLAFLLGIGFDRALVVVQGGDPAATGPTRTPGGGQRPEVSLPELLLGVSELDQKRTLKLDDQQRELLLPLLEEVQSLSQGITESESAMADHLTADQVEFIQLNRQELMRASVQSGSPPVGRALRVLREKRGLGEEETGRR